MTTHCELEVMDPTSEPARRILWSYMDDIVSRYFERPVTDEEITAELQESPSDFLALPHGLFLVAHHKDTGTVLGCAGLRLPEEQGGAGEVKRVFVAHAARGHGLGMRLMTELERLGREHGLTGLRLDTRSDLVEARRLYAHAGYTEVAPFNRNPYATHWLAKPLSDPHRRPAPRRGRACR